MSRTGAWGKQGREEDRAEISAESERASQTTHSAHTHGPRGRFINTPASSQNIDRTKKATCLTFHQRRSQRDTTMSRGIILAQNKNRTLPKQSRPKERLRPSSSPPYPERPQRNRREQYDDELRTPSATLRMFCFALLLQLRNSTIRRNTTALLRDHVNHSFLIFDILYRRFETCCVWLGGVSRQMT